jgi:hypothetical protein
MVKTWMCGLLFVAVFAAGCRDASVQAEPPAVSKSASPATACPQASVWLKEKSYVDGRRGVDIAESNFQVSGCRQAVTGLSKDEKARLAGELDALVAADRAGFKRDLEKKEYRQRIAKRLDEMLGRHVVDDWSADLWQMAF